MSDAKVILVPVQAEQDGRNLQFGVAQPHELPESESHRISNNKKRQGGTLQRWLNKTMREKVSAERCVRSLICAKGRVEREEQEHERTLVQQVTSNPSVLYSFINWEDPGKSLGSLVIVLSLIVSTRYFSPLQWILKLLATILGATSMVELIGKFTTNEGIMARVRPSSYYRPSTETYVRLFSEIQEAVDMTLVKLQSILFAEDLQGSIIGCALSFATYWLIKFISPFWLAILATILAYTLGPIFTGRHSDTLKPAIDQKARDLGSTASDMATRATDQTRDKAKELGSRASETASSASKYTVDRTKELRSQVMDTASTATQNTANRANDLISQTANTASTASDKAAATAHSIKDSSLNSVQYATGTSTKLGQDLGHPSPSGAHSTTNNAQTGTHGVDTQYAYDYKHAPPSAPGFDDKHVMKNSDR